MAQSPDKISYQAVVRNGSNALIVNQQVGVKVSVLQGNANGTAVYTETHTPTTNANGLISIEIGGGVITADSLNKVNWANGPYFIKTEIDPNGGVNYSISGTTQLLSVPYALHARTADSIVGGTNFSGNYNDLTNKPITISNIVGDTFYLSNGGYILSAKNLNNNKMLPIISTKPVVAITSFSALFGGVIINSNDNRIIGKGVVYSNDSNPTLGSSINIPVDESSVFFDSINSNNGSILTPNTKYYVRAYVVTENNNHVYGNQVVFTTLAYTPPTVLTSPVTTITSNSAKFSGNVSNANGNLILERGIIYSTSPNPILNAENKIIMGGGVGLFDSTTSYSLRQSTLVLNPGTTYYVKSYVINQNNMITYGSQVTFTTLSVGQTGPGGGIVFFNKGDTIGGWQYLEAELANRNFWNGEAGGPGWGCETSSIPGTKPEIGYGEINTNIIVANCSDSLFAAKTCFNLVQGGQSDWVLPSIDELLIMYRNLVFTNNGNIINGNIPYWSSTQSDYSIYEVYTLNGEGGISFSFKDDSQENRRFKAIRAY
jgi:hypothetical protein